MKKKINILVIMLVCACICGFADFTIYEGSEEIAWGTDNIELKVEVVGSDYYISDVIKITNDWYDVYIRSTGETKIRITKQENPGGSKFGIYVGEDRYLEGNDNDGDKEITLKNGITEIRRYRKEGDYYVRFGTKIRISFYIDNDGPTIVTDSEVISQNVASHETLQLSNNSIKNIKKGSTLSFYFRLSDISPISGATRNGSSIWNSSHAACIFQIANSTANSISLKFTDILSNERTAIIKLEYDESPPEFMTDLFKIDPIFSYLNTDEATMQFGLNEAIDSGIGGVEYQVQLIIGDSTYSCPSDGLSYSSYSDLGNFIVFSSDDDLLLRKKMEQGFQILINVRDAYGNKKTTTLDYLLPPSAIITGYESVISSVNRQHTVTLDGYEALPNSIYLTEYTLFNNSFDESTRGLLTAGEVASVGGLFKFVDTFDVAPEVAHHTEYSLETSTVLESQSSIPDDGGSVEIKLDNYRTPIGFSLNVGESSLTISPEGVLESNDDRLSDGLLWLNSGIRDVTIIPVFEAYTITDGKDIEKDSVSYALHLSADGGADKTYCGNITETVSTGNLTDGKYTGYFTLTDSWIYNSSEESDTWEVSDKNSGLVKFYINIDTDSPRLGLVSSSHDRTNIPDTILQYTGLTDVTSGIADLIVWNGSIKPDLVSTVEISDANVDLSGLSQSDLSEIRNGNRAVHFRFASVAKEANVDINWPFAVEELNVEQTKTIHSQVIDLAGNESDVKDYSVVYDTIRPEIPDVQDYYFEQDGSHAISVPWNASDDTDIRKYRIEYRPSGAAEYTTFEVQSTETEATIPVTGLPEDTLIEVRVVAIDKAGNEAIYEDTVRTYVTVGIPTGTMYYTVDESSAVIRSNLFSISGMGLQTIECDKNGAYFRIEDTINGQLADSGLIPHESRTYRVVSRTSDETVCETGSPFTFPEGYADYPVETATIIPTAAYVMPNATITWKPAFDPDGDPIVYNIEIGQGASPSDYTIAGTLDGETTAWSLSDYSFAQGGLYSWRIVATAYDTTNTSGVGTFTVDGVGPVVTIVDWPDTYYSNTEAVVVSVVDAIAGGEAFATYTQGGSSSALGVTALGNGTFSIDLSLIAEGEAQVVVTGRDEAGNETALAPIVMRFDRTAPRVASITFDTAAGTDAAVPVVLGLSDERSGVYGIEYGWSSSQGTEPSAWSSMRIENQASLTGTGSDRVYTRSLSSEGAPSSGAYLFVKVVDWAGNTSAPLASSGALVVDTTAPEVRLTVDGLIEAGAQLYMTTPEALSVGFTYEDEESACTDSYAIEEEGASLRWYDSWASARAAASFSDGRRYRIAARATNGAGLAAIARGGWFCFDGTGPGNLSYTVSGATVVPGAGLRIVARASDAGSGIGRIGLAIGSLPGSDDLSIVLPGSDDGFIWKDAGSGEAAFAFTLPEQSSGSYYATIVAENRAGLRTTLSGDSAAFTTAATGGMIVSDQGPYTSETGRLIGKWSYTGPEEVAAYEYRVRGTDGSISEWTETVSTEARIDGLALVHGTTYRIEARAILAGGIVSDSGSSLGVLVDTSGPSIESIGAPEYCGSTGFWISWDAADEESGINRVELLLESHLSEDERVAIGGGWRDVSATPTAVRLPIAFVDNDGLSLLEHGARVYATVRVTNGAGYPSERTAAVTVIDDTPPATPMVIDQGDSINTVQAGEGLDASWIWSEGDTESGIASYAWAVATSRAGLSTAVWHDVGDSLSASTGSLTVEHGDIVYFGVRATNGAGLVSEGVSNGITCDSTAPFIAAVRLSKAAGGADLNYLSSDAGLNLLISAYEDESEISGYDAYVGTVDETGEWSAIGSRHWGGVDATIALGADPIPDDSGIVVFRGESVNTAGEREYGYTTGVRIDTGAPIVTGVYGSGSATGLSFDWTARASIAPIVRYKAALMLVGSVPDVGDWVDLGMATRYAVPASDIAEGRYILYVQAISATGANSEPASSDTLTYDTTPPIVTAMSCPEYASHGIAFTLEAVDVLSGIREYQYALGSADDPTLYSDGWNTVSTRSGSCSGLFEFADLAAPVQDGDSVYLMARVKNSAGLWSGIAQSDRIVIDMSAPSTPVVDISPYTQYLDRIENVAVVVSDFESGVTHLEYGAIRNGEAEPDDWLVMTVDGFVPELELSSSTFSGLSLIDGETYRLAIRARNGAGDWSDAGYSSAIVADATPPSLSFSESGTTIVVNAGQKAVEYWVDEASTITLKLLRPSGINEIVGTTVAEAGIRYQYPFDETIEGVYYLSGTAIDAAGNIGNGGDGAVSQRIRLNAAPIITITPRFSTTPGAPLAMSVSVIDPDASETPGGVIDYRWAGDAQEATSAASPVWVFHQKALWDQTSSYDVSLTVTDADGKSSTATSVVVVENTHSGPLYEDEYWRGEHELRGDVLVPSGITLTLETGTRVVAVGNALNGWSHELRIDGSLLADGASFQERDEGKYWSGLVVAGRATLVGATVGDASRGVTALQGGSVDLSGMTLEDNDIGLHAYGCDVTVPGVLFARNESYAIKEDAGAIVVVTGSTFSENGNDYYDEGFTTVSVAELNAMPGNSGNIEE